MPTYNIDQEKPIILLYIKVPNTGADPGTFNEGHKHFLRR